MSASFRCLVCHGGDSELVYQDCPDYYLGTPFRADYVRCRACGLLQQSPVPRDVSAFYHAYPVHAPKSRLYTVLRWLVMSSIYYDARRHAAGTAILDYGCGDGGYLESLRGRGFRLHGYEKDPAHAARVAERLEVPVDADLEALLASHAGTFDVVTLHKVLEHLTDPDGALAASRRLLKPGGLFLVDFPCTATWDYAYLRAEVAAGHVREVEPNTFVDERAEPEDVDGDLPHHYCDEADVRDLLRRFTIVRLWSALHPAPPPYTDQPAARRTPEPPACACGSSDR